MKPRNLLILLQYAILIASAVNSLAKYTLCAYEHKRAAVRGGENAPPWENKSMYTFYIDLFTGMPIFPSVSEVFGLKFFAQISGNSSPTSVSLS